jgi:AbrB family looped-hinge helix DNA binding protein
MRGVLVSFLLLRPLSNTYYRESDHISPEIKTKTESKVEAILRGQSRMTARGQITVPTEIRKKFGLKTGDILCFLEVDGSIVLKLGPLVLIE